MLKVIATYRKLPSDQLQGNSWILRSNIGKRNYHGEKTFLP
ncbi:hypothetical protein DOT_2591 [Desulfosporosinus sp. OT]|nr:hypothetical protein DOT_2591 [Desulfosporosinus sp. OT]